MCRSAALVLLAACGRVGFDGFPSDLGPSGAPLFADGFEGTLAPWTPSGSPDVTSGPPTPFEGSGMLIARAGSSTTTRAEVPMPITVTSGAVYVRAYFYIPSGFPLNDLSIQEIVQPGPAPLVLANFPTVGLYDAIDPSQTVAGSFAFPRDAWTCVETRVVIAGEPDGSWQVAVDGTVRHSLDALDTFAGGFEQLNIGITWAGPMQPQSTVYVDDVVVDLQPIGCR